MEHSRATALAGEYNRILQSCPDNHDNVDFDIFRIQHPKDFPMLLLHRWFLWWRSQLQIVGPYLVAMVAPPLVVLLVGT